MCYFAALFRAVVFWCSVQCSAARRQGADVIRLPIHRLTMSCLSMQLLWMHRRLPMQRLAIMLPRLTPPMFVVCCWWCWSCVDVLVLCCCRRAASHRRSTRMVLLFNDISTATCSTVGISRHTHCRHTSIVPRYRIASANRGHTAGLDTPDEFAKPSTQRDTAMVDDEKVRQVLGLQPVGEPWRKGARAVLVGQDG